MQDGSSVTRAKRLEQLISFGDEIINSARDHYGSRSTPLFVDGLDLKDNTPITGSVNEEEWVACNMACQQNFFRFLVGLTELTGLSRFKDAACDALAYHFKKLQSPCGLMQWGGHRHLDLKTMGIVGSKAKHHELKFNFPYYELMWEVDPDSTADYIRAFWNAHILDWKRLDMNRHGQFGLEIGELWDNDFEPAEPFFFGEGLTFINCGTDLIYAAAQLYDLGGEQGAFKWSKRMAQQYVRARHPETSLGVYQYSQAKRRKEPPEDTSVRDYTFSVYGDRLKRQFGPEFGEIALEGNFLDTGRGHSIYGNNALIQLQLAETLGKEGREFLEWTIEGMKAYIKYAYLPEMNMLKPLWTDGTDLSFYPVKRYGYRGQAGRIIEPGPAGSLLFLSSSRAYRLTGDERLWVMVRNIGRGLGLGDIGSTPDGKNELNPSPHSADPLALLGLLELDRISEKNDYLVLAECIGGNILRRSITPETRENRFLLSQPEPLALLHLEAALDGKTGSVPEYRGGK